MDTLDTQLFKDLQQQIELKSSELKALRKQMRPLMKQIKEEMKEKDQEEMDIGGYKVRRKKRKSVSFTGDKVKDFAPEADWEAYEETHEKESVVLKVEKSD